MPSWGVALSAWEAALFPWEAWGALCLADHLGPCLPDLRGGCYLPEKGFPLQGC